MVIRYFGAIQNMGWFDRALRFVLGLGLIVAALVNLESSEDVGVYAYLMIIAIYPMMTAILGWDPFYHLGHVKSCEISGRNVCGTFPFEVEAALGKKMECDEGYDCSLAGNRHAHEGHH